MFEAWEKDTGSSKSGELVAIIPARAGSKRLKNKNIKDFNGLSLVEWTILAAKKAGIFSEIIISSDSRKILEIGEKHECTCIMRDASLATDTASTSDVVEDVIKRCAKFETFMLLQPTSPLRTALDINMAYKAFMSSNSSSLVSLTPCEHSPMWSCTISEEQKLEFMGGLAVLSKRSQDLQDYFRLNGAIYIHEVAEFISNPLFVKKETVGFVMPNERSIDIDTQFDFLIASLLHDEISTVS